MPKPTRQLKNVRLSEVSCVDNGDNPSAHILLVKAKNSGDEPGNQAGQSGNQDSEGSSMSLKKKYGLPETATDAELEKAMTEALAKSASKSGDDEKAATELAKAKAEAAEFKAMSEMSDITKARYTELKAKDEPAAAAWLAKSEADRLAAIEIEKKGDESFTDANGTVISKRAVGDATYSMLKSMHEQITKQAEELSIEKTARETTELEKRAVDEYGNIAKKAEVVSILRIAKRAPKADGEAVIELLKQHNDLLGLGLKKNGHRGDESAAGDDPEAKLDKMVKSYAKEKAVSEDTAYQKVLETAEGRALYAEMETQ